jgi:hypothetical protein
MEIGTVVDVEGEMEGCEQGLKDCRRMKEKSD